MSEVPLHIEATTQVDVTWREHLRRVAAIVSPPTKSLGPYGSKYRRVDPSPCGPPKGSLLEAGGGLQRGPISQNLTVYQFRKLSPSQNRQLIIYYY